MQKIVLNGGNGRREIEEANVSELGKRDRERDSVESPFAAWRSCEHSQLMIKWQTYLAIANNLSLSDAKKARNQMQHFHKERIIKLKVREPLCQQGYRYAGFLSILALREYSIERECVGEVSRDSRSMTRLSICRLFTDKRGQLNEGASKTILAYRHKMTLH